MAQETITDYEVKTEEKTRTITICDNCGATEEEKTIVPVGINPKVEVKEYDKREIIQVYGDKAEAEAELHRQLPSTPKEVPTQWGVGINHNTEIKDAHVSAQSDLCVGCVDKFLDVDIPDDEEISDIEFEKGGISIKTEKNIERKYPQLKMHTLDWVDLVVVVLWPAALLFLFLDLITEPKLEDDNDVEEYEQFTLAMSLGAVFWSVGLTYILM